jgi:hypothetical protein
VLKVDVQDQKTMTRINKTAVSLSGIRIFYSMLNLILKKKTCMCSKWFDNKKIKWDDPSMKKDLTN